MVRLDKEWEKHKAGKEEVTEEKPKKTAEIVTDDEQLMKLCEDYPSVAIELRRWVKEKINYYSQHPFNSRTRSILFQKIKESIVFINKDIKEEQRSNKPQVQQKNEALIQQFRKNITFFTDMRNLAEQFLNLQPVYYDRARNWWLWSWQECKWERVDDKDILNAVDNQARIDTIRSKEKNEILEALMQVSRQNKPKEIPPTWIQFKDKIVDIETGEKFDAKPWWFVTNPIPYSLHQENHEETPTMDRIFEEWVGKDNVRQLYEILAYSLLPSYPIHRIFCFIGGGMNGKTCYLNLLRKFVGGKNVCSTDLDLLLSSKFEVTRLHKKLVCQMGETNFSEMKKTSILKKLSGGDLIGFEYKNKDPFEEHNYAKIIIATNNLPTTTDKTIGFYRRWMIIDFPNQFSEAKDILAEIPEEEYECLALKCCAILKDLIKTRKFTNEGSIEERTKKYEDHSDPLEKFMKEYTKEDTEGFIWKHEFEKKLNEWCKENRFREMSEVVIGRKMKEKGIEQGLKQANWGVEGKRFRAWLGIKWEGNNAFEQDEQDEQVTPIRSICV